MRQAGIVRLLLALSLGLSGAAVSTGASGCSSSDAGGAGGAGAGGSGGGGGGSGTAGATGSGGSATAGFMAVAPCATETTYTTTGTTIAFGAATAGYAPKCLRVAAGSTVTFMSGEVARSFSDHPLAPSPPRGTATPNPIPSTSTGATKDVTFPVAGFFPYYCSIHGSETGTGWAGVVWVQ